MTALSAFSYGFIAFGPMAVLFIFTVARKSYEVIIMMSSAFFWLLSLLVTSIIWKIIPPLEQVPAFHIPFSVVLQEVFRLLLFLLLRKTDKVLEVLTDDKTSRRRHRIAYALGTNAIMFLHIVWSVLWFSGWYTFREEGMTKSSSIMAWVKILTVFITHMAVSCLSLLTSGHSSAYFLVAAYVSVVILAEFALVTAGATPSSMINFFKIKK